MAFEHPSGLPYAYDRARDRDDLQSVVFYGQRPIVQGAELNDLQSIINGRQRRQGRLIARNGDRVEGAFAIVDRDAERVTLSAGRIYIEGDVVPVAAAVLEDVSMTGSVSIGVRLVKTWLTHEEDETLLGLVAGADSEGEPGAARETWSLQWAIEGDGGEGEYHQIYLLQDGTILDQTPPPALDGIMQGLALYDRPHGHYIVSGCRVTALGRDGGGNQVFSIEEGEFNVNGFKTVRFAALRHKELEDWDVAANPGETHTYPSGATHTFAVDNAPIDEISTILLTKEKTASITRGAIAHGADALPDTSVIQVIEVKQGATVYVEGTDFNRVGNAIDWAPLGAEPAPSSTYNVTYRYRDAVVPVSFTDTHITVSGGATGGDIIVSYTSKLPRIDRLCLAQDGMAVYVKGVSARKNALAPIAPDGLLPLCTITNDWISAPRVANDGNYMPTVAEQMVMWRVIEQHSRLIQLERLKSGIDAREPTGKKGMFVDPLIDDTFRDAGEPQTAAIWGGRMELPITVTVHPLALSGPVTLDYVEEVVVDQSLDTGCEKINPYANFTPLPGAMTITPAADFWTESRTEWTSPETREFNRGVMMTGGPLESTSVANELVSQRTEQVLFLREIEIAFTVKGFGHGEILEELLFDGIDVTPDPALTGDVDGIVTGAFTIPANVTAGTKMVQATGASGVRASAQFTGHGTIEVDVMRRVTTIESWSAPDPVERGGGSVSGFHAAGGAGGENTGGAGGDGADPQAQIFKLAEPRQLLGVDFKLCKIGDDSNDILVHQVTVTNGIPTVNMAAEAHVDMAGATNGWKQARYSLPTTTSADRDSAFVIKTDDNEHSVAVATLGDFDAEGQQWVTAHPYPIGPRQSSVNARTWTAHQDSALTFRLVAAKYTSTTKVIDLGTVDLVDCSDLQIRAVVELPFAGCSVVFEIERPNGTIWRLLPFQVLQLQEYVTETVEVRAVLTGTEKLSPILYAPLELLAGEIAMSMTYVSRAFQLGNPAELVAYMKAFLPGGATLTVDYDLADGNWQSLPVDATEALAFPQWVERKHKKTGVIGVEGRIRITGTGAPDARLIVGDLGAAVKA